MASVGVGAAVETAAEVEGGPTAPATPRLTPPEIPLPRSLQDSLASLGPARPLPPPQRPARAPEPDDGAVTDAPTQPPPRLTPQAIVRALAATHPALDADAGERPPMIIERALVERDMPFRSRQRPSAWPPLLAGFALSLLAGAALYVALAG